MFLCQYSQQSLNTKHAMIVGGDSLRCLALATVDEPRKKDDMNLTDPTQFIHFEVGWLCCQTLITFCICQIIEDVCLTISCYYTYVLQFV